MSGVCGIFRRLYTHPHTHTYIHPHKYIQEVADVPLSRCKSGPSIALTQVRRLQFTEDEATAHVEEPLIAETEEDLSLSNFLVEMFGRGMTPHFFKVAYVMLEGQQIKSGPLEMMLATDNVGEQPIKLNVLQLADDVRWVNRLHNSSHIGMIIGTCDILEGRKI